MIERIQKAKAREASEKRKERDYKIEKARRNQEEIIEQQRCEFLQKEAKAQEKLEKFKHIRDQE